MEGQRVIGTICECGKKLPALIDKGGWGVLDCPDSNCGKWYDVQRALTHQGVLIE